jgi:hypothetical protein
MGEAQTRKSGDSGARFPAKKAARLRMNQPPGFGLIERARALAPLIAREADEIERTRCLTEPLLTALIKNGFYRVLLPQSVGGAEAPPRNLHADAGGGSQG